MPMTYCPLFSGSSGNAALLEAGNTRLLVDAGLPGRTITSALEGTGRLPESLQGILITHEHSDHIKGAGILSRKYDLPIYANAGTWEAMESQIGRIAPKNIRIFETGHEFFLGQLAVFPYAISHDAAEPVGFSFYHQGSKISQATDLGRMTPDVLEAVKGSDLLLLESNHDVAMLKAGRYTYALKQRILGNKGHLSNDAAALACVRLANLGVRRFILGHLSRENNFEELAYETCAQALTDAGARLGEEGDVSLYLAHWDRPTALFTIG